MREDGVREMRLRQWRMWISMLPLMKKWGNSDIIVIEIIFVAKSTLFYQVIDTSVQDFTVEMT